MSKPIIAKSEDGGVQITFTVPFAEIKKAQDETVLEMAKDIEVPGFRKGNAPIDKVREKIPQANLIEHSLGHILPTLLAQVIKDNDLKLAMYPKFELVKAEENKDWEIVGKTCELPTFDLGDYKKLVSGEIRAASLKRELSREEKEQVVIKTLIDNIKINIPTILIEEEVSSRLSSLLSRIEKLGLALENYLTSIGKTPESIRSEYEVQSKEAISLDLILSEIAQKEDVKVSEAEIEQTLKTAQDSNVSSQRRLVESILRKRHALEILVNLT